MSFDSPRKVKEACKKYGLRPSKFRGQNFLIDKNVVQNIIKACELGRGDKILEIGPGLGVLTDELSKKAKKILAVDIDANILDILDHEFDWNNVELIRKDILKLPNEIIAERLGRDYFLVSNLPYQISSEVLEKFLTQKPKPKKIIIMVQREFGERMLEGAPHANLLSLMVEFNADVKKLFRVSKNSFWPVPKVDSVIMEVIPRDRKFLSKEEQIIFWDMVKSGFRSKRKYLISNLDKYTNIPKKIITSSFDELELDRKIRPENLGLKDWLAFFHKIN